MKFLFLVFLFISISNLHAFEISKNAVVRDEHFNAQIKNILLTDLFNTNSFEGKYFKIVLAKSDVPISFEDSQQLQLKAATVYYHLTKARDFFVNTVNSDYVKSLPQLTIRLELTNVFNEIGHYAHDNLDPQFNNALSIPAGLGSETRQVDPWGMEIWFRPKKVIQIDNGGDTSGLELKSALKSFRNQTHLSNLDSFIRNYFQFKANGMNGTQSAYFNLVQNSLIVELIYQSSSHIGALFSQHEYFLDSALVPEIIYHEFSHIALSEHLMLTHSSPVNEGLADYFAGKIANSKKLATHIKEYNLFSGKQVHRKQQYRLYFEQGEMANNDFVFGLLWNLGQKIGSKNEISFIHEMSARLESSSTIKEDLINAALVSCKSYCPDPVNDRFKLFQFFNAKNF